MTAKRFRRATAALGTTALVTAGIGAPPANARAAPVRQPTLAASLGITQDELQAAMAKDAPPPPRSLTEALADELGVDTADVQRVIDADRPKPGTNPDRTTLLAALVSGLHLDEAVVTAAFDRVDEAKSAEHRARIAGLAAKLAQRSG